MSVCCARFWPPFFGVLLLYHRPKKRENAKVEVFEAAGKGMGLKLLEPVSKGQFIAEYVGEVNGVGLDVEWCSIIALAPAKMTQCCQAVE